MFAVTLLLVMLSMAHFCSSGKPKHPPPPPRPEFGPAKAPLVPGSNYPRFPNPPVVSKHTVNIAGLVVNIFGLDDLAPIQKGVPPPPIHAAFYMHGRTRSADFEETHARYLYHTVRQYMVGDPAGSAKDFLLLTFDARDHGARMNDLTEQGSWASGNPNYITNLYSMMSTWEDAANVANAPVGDRQDVSYIIDLFNTYAFPNDERVVDSWTVTGRSLGGHATWHVLAFEPRVKIGISFSGAPDYKKLTIDHTKKDNRPLAPPFVPGSLMALMNQTNPASLPFTSHNAKLNPFWGKKVLSCHCAADPVVPFEYSRDFLGQLVLGPTQKASTNRSLEVFIQPACVHEITPTIMAYGARWIYRWGIAKAPKQLPLRPVPGAGPG